jgi:hypothetical protein
MHTDRLQRILRGMEPSNEVFLRSAFRVAGLGVRGHLEHISRVVLHGFLVAAEGAMGMDLASRLNQTPPEFRGFAYTGAGMRLALLDALQDERQRLSQFIDGPASPHADMVQLGVGWAIARTPSLRTKEESFVTCADEISGWNSIVGFGLHQVYFHWPRYVDRQLQPDGFSLLGQGLFDCGVGFGLWLGDGGSVDRVSATIANFPPYRQPNLWTGLGFGVAYAGGTSVAGCEYLNEACGPFHKFIAEGAALAARTRYKAQNLAPYTDCACRRFCGMSAETAAQWTENASQDAHAGSGRQKYEIWRLRIRSRFSKSPTPPRNQSLPD